MEPVDKTSDEEYTFQLFSATLSVAENSYPTFLISSGGVSFKVFGSEP
jgi:hypothetical protein